MQCNANTGSPSCKQATETDRARERSGTIHQNLSRVWRFDQASPPDAAYGCSTERTFQQTTKYSFQAAPTSPTGITCPFVLIAYPHSVVRQESNKNKTQSGDSVYPVEEQLSLTRRSTLEATSLRHAHPVCPPPQCVCVHCACFSLVYSLIRL